MVSLERLVQRAERGAHRARGVVLVGLRVAEVHEQPVAEVLRDVARVALDHCRRRILIGAHDAAEIFGVEALREIGGAHQVAEHHGELAALGVGRLRKGTFLVRPLQRRAARPAEAMLGRVRLRAGRADLRERRTAAAAEAIAGRVLVGAGGADHAAALPRLEGRGRAPL